MLTCDLTLSPATTVTSQGWSRNLCWAAVVGDLSTNTTRKILTMVLVSGEGDIGLSGYITLTLTVCCSSNLSLQAVNSNNLPSLLPANTNTHFPALQSDFSHFSAKEIFECFLFYWKHETRGGGDGVRPATFSTNTNLTNNLTWMSTISIQTPQLLLTWLIPTQRKLNES